MIRANVSRMFAKTEPCYVSASQSELGEAASTITWRNALSIAGESDRWLLSDLAAACKTMRRWAIETGAWDREEVAAWPDDEALALFVQNIAGELRECLAADANGIDDVVLTYEGTDWDKESSYPIGCYYFDTDGAGVLVDWEG